MFQPGAERQEGGLFPISPMHAKERPCDSVSLAGPADTSSGMSVDDSTSSAAVVAPQRVAFGELQNNFEFKTLGGRHGKQQQLQQAGQPGSKAATQPFTFGAWKPQQPAAAAAAAPLAFGAGDARRPQDQAMHSSREPTTPGSFTSESRGAEPGPPPLTTLDNLNTFGGGSGAGSDSDTVTPLAPAFPASRVPLSSSPVEVTPAAGAAKARTPLAWSDVLLWRQPLQTTTIFISGLLGFWLLTFAAYGAHRFTLVSGLSYLLLLDLGANFFRYFVSKSWHDQCLWGGPAQMKHFLTSVNAYMLHLAAAHDRYLSAVDPFVTLKVAGALWAAAWLGSYLSLWWCMLLGYIGAFTVPVAYQASKGQLEAAARNIRAHTIDRVDAMGLPRTVRFLALVAAVATLWCTSSFAQSAIGFFVALTYWRTLLAPREIDVIRTVAEPYTASAFKVGRRITTAASDAFDRMSTAGPKSRTKSHFGKARME